MLLLFSLALTLTSIKVSLNLTTWKKVLHISDHLFYNIKTMMSCDSKDFGNGTVHQKILGIIAGNRHPVNGVFAVQQD